MSANKQGSVSFIYIANPLTPAESRNVVEHKLARKKSLAKYLGPLEGEWAVSVSGRVVHKSEWTKTFLQPNDCVVVAPILMGGGGDGKSIVRLVAIVALTVVAGAAGSAMAGAGYGAVAIGVAQAGIMLAGTLVINAVLPPPAVDLGNSASGGDYDSSPTYGIDGPKNISSKNIPVPVIYGETWFAGNFIQSYTVNDSDDQYLHLLMNVGEGPIESIDEIQINDQKLSNFAGVEVFTRLGTADQAPIPYFNDVIRPVNRSANLSNSSPLLHTLSESVDRVRIDITAPRGLSNMTDEGMKSYTTGFVAQIREVGTEAWLPLVDGGADRVNISGRTVSPLRRSYWSGTLNRSKRYEIRLLHTEGTDNERIANALTLTDINEIQFGELNYKHTALLGLRIKLTDQLNGLPKVVYRVRGRKIRVWGEATGSLKEEYSRNPAWIVLDAMTSERFGGRVRLDRFKLSYFRKWAQYCDANSLFFNGAIDQKTNLWDALLPVYKVGRAMPVRSGTKFQVAVMSQRKPVQLFSMGNIKKGSMNVEWLQSDDRANEITVTYYDKDDFGKPKQVTVRQKRAVERGDAPKGTEQTLFGVNNLTQATKDATLAMNMNLLYKTISFEAPLESIACTMGDVIAVQHDMPKWGQGGLLAPGSTKTKLMLDRQVEFDREGQWVALVRHDTVVQWSGKVEAIVGNSLILDYTFNAASFERFRRLKNAVTNAEFTVQESITDGLGRQGVLLDSVAGVKVGDAVQLIDTDVIETVNVVKPTTVNEVAELELASPLAVVPTEGASWAFGLKESVVSLFSVSGIDGKGDMWRKISALEYSDEAYSDTVNEFKPGSAPALPVLGNVNFDGFFERRYLDGGIYRSTVEFKWTHSSDRYLYSEIHASINGDPYRLLGAAANSYSVELSAGDLKVKIVPVNLQGSKPSLNAVTEHSYTVELGAPEQPPAPTNIRATVSQGIVELKWGDANSLAATRLVHRYEVWVATGTSDQVSILDAQLLAITGENYFIHAGVLNDTYYTYWIRAINVLDTSMVSAFMPNTGLTVKTSAPLNAEDLFPGGITLEDINIDGLEEEVTREVVDKINQISDIVSQVATKVEAVGDANRWEVFNRKEALGAVESMVRQEIITLTEKDQALAAMVTTLESKVSDDIAAKLTQESITRASADEALAASVTTLQAKVNNDITASITEESAARATADEALASSVSALQAKVNNDITAAINEEKIVRAAADSSLAASVSSLQSKVNNDITAAINEEKIARTNADSSLAASITSLQSKVNNDITAAIQAEEIARTNADGALTTQVQTAQSTANGKNKTYRQASAPTTGITAGDIWFDSDDGNKQYRYTGSTWAATDDARIAQNIAAINQESVTRADAVSALTNQVNTAKSVADSKNKTYLQPGSPTTGMTVGDIWFDSDGGNKQYRYNGTAWVAAEDARIAQNAAAITAEAQTRANADSALAAQITTLTASTNANFASVSTEIAAQATYTDGAVARAVTTATVNGRQAIFGINVNGQTADIGAVADRFFIYNPVNGEYKQTFLVEGGKVYMDAALIKDASITSAKIANAAINTAQIADAAITMAKIAGSIQSSNYVAGQTGWRLTKTGEFEMNSSVPGGGRVVQTNKGVKVYDGNGRLRVQLGDLTA